MPLRVSFPGPVRCLACLGGGGGMVPFRPCLAWGCVLPFGRALGACGWGRGCRGCGRVDPSPTPQRALLRAGFARCGGSTRAPGGAPLAWIWGVRGRALSHPRPPVLWGVRLGPTTHWLWVQGVRACGPVTNPTARALVCCLCALWGRLEGARGEAPLAWVWGVRGRALSHPQPPVLWGVAPGPITHWLWVRGVRALGPVTNPTARALASWFGTLWGRHEGARGGRLLPGCASCGVRRSPTPDRPSFGACDRGSLAIGCGCGGCGRGDPSPTLQRALLRAGFARCGGGTRAPGGGRLLPRCGSSGVGRSPSPDRPSFGACGRDPLPTGCECRGCGCRDPSPTPQSALLRASVARCGGGTRAPVGGASCLGVGRPWSGALPPQTARPLGRAAGAHHPLAAGAGGEGVGTRHQTPQRALLRAGFARCGGSSWAPGGGASCLGVGRPGSDALPPPTARPLGRAAGANYPLAVGAQDAGVGTRHQPHSACSCEMALCAVAAAGGHPGGAPLAWLWGVGGRALSRPQPPVLWGVRPGPTTHWLWVRGVRAWGHITNPTAHALASWLGALWGRHQGARGGAPLALVWGIRGRALSQPRPPVLWGVRPGPATHWLWVRCAGVGARLSLAPPPEPRFVVCCARFPGLWHPVAVSASHLSSCRGCGRRRASLACLVAPRWCAAPRQVRSLSLLRSAFPSPWCLPPARGLSPPALLGGCAGHVKPGRVPGSVCLRLAPADSGALSALRVILVRGPAMGLSLAGPSGFGLGLRTLRWFGVCGPCH